ncbi:hypothetical protein J7E99_05250 [Streptomyces sp. ISL-44]|uniref:hypothetical protein n=1 Tax=unclassified Streptomyces TaxID=2593676 RepID=UPI001BE6B031|nr:MULTISPECIES: hypothetical protein [unclassified Streptomyces]MBT2540125.1 hypothetical protein [Streptomyces sp. ISL-44]MCX5015289.1 hypothetical protein [Streptomyces sp. NBC_00555]MCX5610074.1 hypothetical protein [Streptomyces sp. NBC_00047]UUU43950.1 hypothetical protein JIW86_37160 [Streptomyces sp. NBC_00162]
MRSVRSLVTILAAGVVILGGASAASADVNVNFQPEPSYTFVFGDWLQFAADDVFNAGHDNTVGSNN